jgi:hypothetical protein
VLFYEYVQGRLYLYQVGFGYDADDLSVLHHDQTLHVLVAHYFYRNTPLLAAGTALLTYHTPIIVVNTPQLAVGIFICDFAGF